MRLFGKRSHHRPIARGNRCRPHSPQAGILIMDCLMYMGLLFLIVSMGYVVFYRGWDNFLNLRRNADQIAAVLRAGECWREDVRTETGQARIEATSGEQILHLPHGRDEICYRASRDAVWRRANNASAWMEILNRVKSSQMDLDSRQKVTAWRWELELKTRQPKRRLQPVFTFEAVPPQDAIAPSVVANTK